jgi:putative transposase
LAAAGVSCWTGPLSGTSATIWNQRHLMMVLREYQDFYNSHRPHRALDQAAPLRPLPDGVTDLDHFQVRRHDRAGGVIHEYRLVA